MEPRFLPLCLSLPASLAWCNGSFSYTKSTHEAKLGPIELSVKDKQTVTCPSGPVWEE